jgi:hypothetical protein
LRSSPFVLSVACAAALWGCERAAPDTSARAALIASPVGDAPTTAGLTAPPADELLRALKLDPIESFPSCHDIFEHDGTPRTPFPVEDEARLGKMLFGCQVEAYHLAPDGSRLMAYALPQRRDGATSLDLRLVRWDKDGALVWSQVMDRSERSASYLATFRGASVADLPPYLSCATTLWDTAVQLLCVQRGDGAVRLNQTLPTWSGIVPVGLDKSLFIADHSGLRRLYPYTGEEQRFVRLLEPGGGKLAMYVHDGQTLYFAPGREAPWQITAYDMATGQQRWLRQLAAQPSSTWAHASAAHKLVLIMAGEQVLGLDAETGALRFKLQVGADAPPVAWGEDTLYVLARRPESSNIVWALDPRTGQARWAAPAPPGTLRLGWSSGRLLLGSVRSIQAVAEVTEAEP